MSQIDYCSRFVVCRDPPVIPTGSEDFGAESGTDTQRYVRWSDPGHGAHLVGEIVILASRSLVIVKTRPPTPWKEAGVSLRREVSCPGPTAAGQHQHPVRTLRRHPEVLLQAPSPARGRGRGRSGEPLPPSAPLATGRRNGSRRPSVRCEELIRPVAATRSTRTAAEDPGGDLLGALGGPGRFHLPRDPRPSRSDRALRAQGHMGWQRSERERPIEL